MNPKYYIFDVGVWRALTRSLVITLEPQTYGCGAAFEHFIVNEIHHITQTRRLGFRFGYLPLPGDREVNLVIERPGLPPALVEIKSTGQLQEKHAGTLLACIAHWFS